MSAPASSSAPASQPVALEEETTTVTFHALSSIEEEHSELYGDGSEASAAGAQHSSAAVSSAPSTPQSRSRSTPRMSALPSSIDVLRAEVDERMALVWKDLTVSVKTKTLIHGISGMINGGLVAIMGPSGSGKSTFLNALACRLDSASAMTGEIHLNGRRYRHAELKVIAGYVMQDDLLNGHFTVRETLDYTAQLRLPSKGPDAHQHRLERVQEVLNEMGLNHVADVIVGDPLKKGISGGERRRLCIGMELLTRPSLLFLDEPTSGLDSVTSLDLMLFLKTLSRTGKCTVICSIHQPQAKIFNLFDELILLKGGRMIFQGPIEAGLELFAQAGFPCPHFQNPADHLLDVITPQLNAANRLTNRLPTTSTYRRSGMQVGMLQHMPLQASIQSPHETAIEMDELNLGEGAILKTVRKKSLNPAPSISDTTAPDVKNEQAIAQRFIQPVVDLGFGSERPLLLERDTVPWFQQFKILLHRSFKEQWRKRNTILTSLLQCLLISLAIGFAFYDIGRGQKSVVKRQPVLFFCVINQGMFGALTVINSFPQERLLALRERAAGTYHASAYFLAKTTAESATQVIFPIFFSIIVYYLVGFQDEGSKFIIFCLFMILCNLSATSLALAISAVCKTTDLSVTVLPMTLELARLFGGFFLSPANSPKYFSWLEAISYVKYTYVGISLNELHDLKLSCSDSANGSSCIDTGEKMISNLGLDFITIQGCFGVLIAFIFVARTISYLGIRYLKS